MTPENVASISKLLPERPNTDSLETKLVINPFCDVYLAQSKYLTTNCKYIFYKYNQAKQYKFDWQDPSWPLLCNI